MIFTPARTKMTRHSFTNRVPYSIPILSACLIMCLVIALPARATTETVHYTYDNARQLTKTVYDSGLAAVSYGYDSAGNRETRTTTSTDTTPPSSAITRRQPTIS